MKKPSNISKVISKNVCIGCGACVGICPNSALKMVKTQQTYLPIVSTEKCGNCGLCLRICPSESVDFKSLNLMLFEKEPDDALSGNYLKSYIGFSTDLTLRLNSSSGGLVSQLLINALNQGIINAAIVTKMNNEKPLEPEPFVARSNEEIKNASKSKYCPVPLGKMLKEVIEEKHGKFAVVGLPCHIQAIRKAEKICPDLKNKIVLHVGLACGHAPTFLATDFLLWNLKIDKKSVAQIQYRSEGWPGYFSVFLKNGKKVMISYNSLYYWGLAFGQFFYMPRCALCGDKLCELADVSFGDAWTNDLISTDNLGTSFVISRNKVGEKLLQEAVETKSIQLEEVHIPEILQSQRTLISKKRVKSRQLIFKLFGKEILGLNYLLPDAKPLDYLRAIIFYLLSYLPLNKLSWKAINLYVKFSRYYAVSFA